MAFRSIFLLTAASALPAADLRLGIVGTDTSHVIAFTKVLNDPSNKDYIPGAKVVAAFKGGSPDLESSRSRVDGYAKELAEKWGIEIVPDIPTLCSKVDAVLLESVDGRPHLAQARQIIAAGKPMFIDKPLSSTLDDAREIARLAKEKGVKWFSSSSLRYSDIVTATKAADASGAITWGPGPLEEHHQLGLSWYAIHPIEMLFSILGPGCQEVTRTYTEASDEVTCRWKDGKIGTVRALRPYGGYGAVVFHPKKAVQSPANASFSYVPLLKEIVKFFQTGVVPVSNEETLEIFAFMDAAERSKAAGGRPMKLR
ncbi:MAG: Gfo/Idh/MocA family oxidoreductase [Acidobacteria bacterium]|nr:Gfo/Idh/MocA family oxidoreductase [Acidobacteriota bacterium]